MTVVVGYVPAPVGEAALRYAADEARRRGEPLIVLNTSRGDRVADPRLIPREQVAELEASIGEDIDVKVCRAVDDKEPWEQIVDTAEQTEATVIVIGLRRRSSVGKMVLGSNAQRILMEAPCPVVTVKSLTGR
ncbi:MAG TPA: universal stress protein [Isosphaeraceae bacterium]|nr:universal stress protein [Isosphaeraceae bacterium]